MKIAATSNSRYYVNFDSYDYYADILLLNESNLRSINLFFTDIRAIDVELMGMLREKVLVARKRNICIKLIIFTLDRIDNKFIREKVFGNISRGYQIQGGRRHRRKLGNSKLMSIFISCEDETMRVMIVSQDNITHHDCSRCEIVSCLNHGKMCFEFKD